MRMWTGPTPTITFLLNHQHIIEDPSRRRCANELALPVYNIGLEHTTPFEASIYRPRILRSGVAVEGVPETTPQKIIAAIAHIGDTDALST